MTDVVGRLPRRQFLLASAGTALGLTQLGQAAIERPAWAQTTEERPPTVRVLLRRDGRLDAATARVTSDGAFAVRDLAADSAVASVGANEVVTVGQDDDGLWFRVGDGKRRGPFGGRLQVAASDPGARVSHLSAGAKPLTYRGGFELAGSDGRVALLNVLGVDDYVPGVVPREMPVSFGAEAARAQAVAARGFVLARKANSTHEQLGADVCDGVDCQSYGGVAAEDAVSNAAVEATRGLVLTRGSKLVEPFYASTCGGHTEAVARLFGSSTAQGSPGAVADGDLPAGADLSTEAGAATFYKGRWGSNCAQSPRYRWKVSWGDRRELEEILDAGLRRLAGGSTVSPAFSAAGSIGTLTGLAVAERGASGRVLSLRVEGTQGAWTVKRDWPIRGLLRSPSGELLQSSAFVLELSKGADGKPGEVTAFGGGWGHGVGMCQWGTRGLADKGLTYDAILAHYFPESELVTVDGRR